MLNSTNSFSTDKKTTRFFMEPEGSLLCSQERATCPYLESSPHHHALLLQYTRILHCYPPNYVQVSFRLPWNLQKVQKKRNWLQASRHTLRVLWK